ncbi:MAG: hypothetical protein C0467_25280 [Planctomycetaceae bacterium]|nr:hypothetical protein [Planctomycetaceae bacterium]
MAGIQWAADLREALLQTGTGQGKLDLIAAAMSKRFDDPAHADKDPQHPDRHLTAVEAVAVLQKAGAGDVTLEKCRQLLMTGEYAPPKPAASSADRLPPPPKATAPTRRAVASDEPVVQPVSVSFVNESAETIGPREIQEPEEQASGAAKPAGKPRASRAKKPKVEAVEKVAEVTAEENHDGDGSGLPDPGEGPGGTAAE